MSDVAQAPSEGRENRGWVRRAVVRTGGLALAAGLVGFVLVPVLQPVSAADGALSPFQAICRAVGLTSGNDARRTALADAVTPSTLAWSPPVLAAVGSGNAAHGATLAGSCTACHGLDGNAEAGPAPNLAGLSSDAFYKQMADYRSGKRRWPVMGQVAASLSESDVADLAAYYATLPRLAAPAPPSWSAMPEAAVRRLVELGDPGRGLASCSGCHAGDQRVAGAPVLDGQRADYTLRQLNAYAASERRNDLYTQMRAVARALRPDERRSLAAWYAAAAPVPAREAQGSGPHAVADAGAAR